MDEEETAATGATSRGGGDESEEPAASKPPSTTDAPTRDDDDAEMKEAEGADEGSGDAHGATEPPAEDGMDEDEDDAEEEGGGGDADNKKNKSKKDVQVPPSKVPSNAEGAATAAAAPPPSSAPPARKKKPTLKKRSRTDEAPSTAKGEGTASTGGASRPSGSAASKKRKAQRRANNDGSGTGGGGAASGKSSSGAGGAASSNSNNPSHQAVRDQMRRVLEEDHYSAHGSIVDTDSDSDDGSTVGAVDYKGSVLRLDRPAMMQYATQYLSLLTGGTSTSTTSTASGGSSGGAGAAVGGAGGGSAGVGGSVHSAAGLAAGGGADGSISGKRKDAKTSARSTPVPGAPGSGGGGAAAVAAAGSAPTTHSSTVDPMTKELEDEWEMDGSSIFGQTTGSSNFTWVECDKCKKWRRLRGVVDEKKLPSRWYCSMNKNDPERSKCSAPEEEYDTSHATPESAADARVRKHLRVWVRRLQCNEAYEARQPTQTRGKKKSQSSSKEPYEWIRCCNPGCGKWRSLLRIMEAKTVIDKTQDGEWYCVMNTWDEKVASCAAPQENLPAVGCPPWVLLDDADS